MPVSLFACVVPECGEMKPSASGTGNACVGKNVKWLLPAQGSVISGKDITSKGGMNVTSCRQFCWETPGCLSADLHVGGTCYLNNDKGPIAKDINFVFLNFECCDSK